MAETKRRNGALMRPQAVADYLGIGLWSVRKLVQSGKLKGTRCTGSKHTSFITRTSVEAFARGE